MFWLSALPPSLTPNHMPHIKDEEQVQREKGTLFLHIWRDNNQKMVFNHLLESKSHVLCNRPSCSTLSTRLI